MKLQIQAPEVVVNYYKYIGGVDIHDKLQITFALGKRHKFEKYYVKLLLFLVDIFWPLDSDLLQDGKHEEVKS